MNTRGNPKRLVASQPGNLNAVKQRVHSPRLIQARAAEIASELTRSFEFSPAERLAAHEAARCSGSPSVRMRPQATDSPRSKNCSSSGRRARAAISSAGAAELTEREHAIREAIQRQSLAQRERELGIG